MAFDVLDEHEQGELVQKWLRENAMAIAVGIGLGLALIFGWQQWQTHKATAAAAASAQFQALTEAVAAKKDEDAQKVAAAIRSEYPQSIYSVFAALQQADLAVQKGDLNGAAEQLAWAREHAKTSPLQWLIDLRSARIKLAQGDAAAALKLADGVGADNYVALAGELRGDALAKLGRNDEARKAYEAVLAATDTQGVDRNLLQMKLDNLGASAPAAQKPAT
ncbi:MAG: tetratricopeptide repeat protein [Dokdonella sp.]|uniref:YfgM family protein n=1 Tax=Dokdonella sp. TaxID=2291710 RepID=UPI0025C2F10F|nr:tetratricopeptide repeat protein [Dokdonella sp.]MBZ0221605.1 tetratricopeptide repeat protein [Dokdonella sp.]